MKHTLLAMLALTACSPSDVLRRQGSTLRSTDYVQLAVNEQQKKEAEKEAQEKKEREEKEAVQRQIDKAQAHMDLFEYDAAVGAYREAYRLSQDPNLLVKVAEAHRMTGDCAEAQSLYKQYLDKRPDAPDASSVKARIEEARSCQDRSGKNLETVRRHYKEGVTHYDLAEYAKAVKSFKEAYRLSNDPAYLYNIAQSYRLAGNCAEAGRFYKRVLAVQTNTPNKDKLEARIAEMKACSR